MTANDTVEQRRLSQNSRCLSAGSDSLYLQFKPTIWAQSYPRKHTNYSTPPSRKLFSELRTPLHYPKKQMFY